MQVNDFPLRASMVWATPEEIDSTYAIASALNAYKQALLSSQLTLF